MCLLCRETGQHCHRGSRRVRPLALHVLCALYHSSVDQLKRLASQSACMLGSSAPVVEEQSLGASLFEVF